MKLIQILALATAMATMATAQNSSPANGQDNGAATASPTATPAAKNAAKAPAATKAGAATTAKTTAGTGSSSKPASAAAGKAARPQSGPASNGNKTVAVKTGAVPAHKAGATPQKKPVQVMATPTPVASPRVSSTTAATKSNRPAKTDAKTKAGAKAPAVIAVKPAQTTAQKKTSASAGKKPPVKTSATAPAASQASAAKITEEKPKPVTRAYGARGRRDPFVSPIRDRGPAGPMPNCTTGKRCLTIPELVLQGTVKDTSGKMLAVVANSTKRTYFLRENDQVFNGSVEKITSDSIIFREYVKDALGRETAREVVKKLVPAS